jgi:hypothetical protein
MKALCRPCEAFAALGGGVWGKAPCKGPSRARKQSQAEGRRAILTLRSAAVLGMQTKPGAGVSGRALGSSLRALDSAFDLRPPRSGGRSALPLASGYYLIHEHNFGKPRQSLRLSRFPIHERRPHEATRP